MKGKIRKKIGFVVAAGVVAMFAMTAGCDLLEYHPYEGRVSGEKDIITKNVARIESIEVKGDTVRFAFLSDTQRWYDETADAVEHINRRTDIDFVVHGGDLSDFGVTKEFEWQRDILNELKVPYVTVIGNHDCIGNGEHIYASIFGAENYAFTVNGTRFICLNTVALEYDYSNPVPDFKFIENEASMINAANAIKPDSINRTVFVMHSYPTDEQFNNNVDKVFELYVKQFPGMADDASRFDATMTDKKQLVGTRSMGMCLHGHTHSNDIEDVFDDGILYYGVTNILDRNYYVFILYPDGYDYELVSF